MNSSCRHLDELVSSRFGLEFTCTASQEGGYPVIVARPADLRAPNGFGLVITLSWRTLGLRFAPDNFSRDLIRRMGEAGLPQRSIACGFARALLAGGCKIRFSINGQAENPAECSGWPDQWENLAIECEKLGLEPTPELLVDSSSDVCQLTIDFLGMVISLLPVEAKYYEEAQDNEGFAEGLLFREEVNRYERNPLNREACIALRGTVCHVCDFSFAEVYGELGAGFIHVHHVVPVSKLGSGYIIDPSKDLVPVCANCHAMLHKKDPPLGVDELKQILARHS